MNKRARKRTFVTGVSLIERTAKSKCDIKNKVTNKMLKENDKSTEPKKEEKKESMGNTIPSSPPSALDSFPSNHMCLSRSSSSSSSLSSTMRSSCSLPPLKDNDDEDILMENLLNQTYRQTRNIIAATDDMRNANTDGRDRAVCQLLSNIDILYANIDAGETDSLE